MLSSHFFYLKNENQLCEFVQHMIKTNPKYLSFLLYVYFGLVDQFSLTNLINSIQFDELTGYLSKHLKNSFSSSYCLPFGNKFCFQDDLQIMTFSQDMEEFFEETKLMASIKFLFEVYPTFLSNVLETESNSQIEFFSQVTRPI
jgi:hypothetical protein